VHGLDMLLFYYQVGEICQHNYSEKQEYPTYYWMMGKFIKPLLHEGAAKQ